MTAFSDNKVVLGMSGGVDSSVSAYLLGEAGYEVIGLTLKLFEGEDDVSAAKEVASRFGLGHVALDMKSDFRRRIIEPFLYEYSRARTPNPCIICNPTVKWRAMIEYANEIGAKFVATGHYAQTWNGRILRGDDKTKDQSYFLYRLPEKYIRRTIFPLGSKTKDNVIDVARNMGLRAANRKESIEICFFPKGELRGFLEKSGVHGNPGEFINPDGEIIGRHDGWMHYTIGQRRGLGVPSSEGRLYVTDIDPQSAQITLSTREMLMKTEFNATHCIYHADWPPGETQRANIQIRHGGKTARGEVTRVDEKSARIKLTSPLFAPAPGQSAVFFDNDVVLGGGIIQKIP